MKFLILLLFFFIGANCQAPPDCNSVFMLFIGSNLNDYINVSLTSNIAPLRRTNFLDPTSYTKYYNPSKPTVIYSNGWRLNYQSDDAKAILGNYVSARRSQFNIVYLDWSAYNNNFVYITSLGAMLGVRSYKKLIFCVVKINYSL